MRYVSFRIVKIHLLFIGDTLVRCRHSMYLYVIFPGLSILKIISELLASDLYTTIAFLCAYTHGVFSDFTTLQILMNIFVIVQLQDRKQWHILPWPVFEHRSTKHTTHMLWTVICLTQLNIHICVLHSYHILHSILCICIYF